MIVYFNGSMVDNNNVAISPFDRGFQFGDGVYEVFRYYPKKFFRLDKHIERLKYSLREMEIGEPDLHDLETILYELINKNNLVDELSIAYLQITRGVQFPRGHIFNESITPTIFIYVQKFSARTKEMENGIKVGLEKDIRWHRCDIKTISLIPNILTKSHGAKKGLSEIIFHRDGVVTEGTQANIFFVKDETLFTPPLSSNILAGITRAVVLELAKKLSIEHTERDIVAGEVKEFDEAFFTSTTLEVMPVIEIDGCVINNGTPGKVTRLLQSEFQKLY